MCLELRVASLGEDDAKEHLHGNINKPLVSIFLLIFIYSKTYAAYVSGTLETVCQFEFNFLFLL